MSRIGLGDKVRDIITGFTGIVTVRSEYLNKCVRMGVQSQELKDGVPVDTSFFDEEQLELIASAEVKITKVNKTGGDREVPRRMSDPVRR